ncbi:conserved hypothetical protein [Gloeothece citriformis PCC 7424]|uniref:DUF4359 domain-containing protein n=1 Tax=Gloeothece citriformis (strain PCC 7424) TaxID=65393 RepID=B7K7H8_GLOC7|nr:DUF4359 domain-containing protein [Gloeothece citriformis]ACK69746.1 conserved hypothetical protein [Gloeothece citriformis PCC 7424]
MKKNVTIGGIVLVAVGIAMGVTNPNPQAYINYMSEKLLTEGEKVFCQKTEACQENSSGIVKNALAIVRGKVARPLIQTVIEESTTRQNFLLFSLYNTEVPDVGSIKTLGILNQFFIYSKSSQ